MLQAAWTRFAHKAVIDQANVKPGEVFTVLTDDRSIPEIPVAVFKVGLTVTRQTQLITICSRHYSEEPVHLNKAMDRALKESDVVLSICETRIGQIPEVHEALAGGTRFLLAEPGPRPDYLIDGLINVDYEQMLKNVELLCNLWQGQKCRMTSEVGTDLEFDVGDRPKLVSEGAVNRPGQLDWFPGAMGNVAPIEESINGTIVVDGSLFPVGIAQDLVTLEMEKGIIKDIKGGKFAMGWKTWLESLNDPVVYHLCHVSVGFNPRAELTGWIFEDERVMGAITIGFGRQSADWGGKVFELGGSHHIDVILSSVTITAGEKVLLMNNEFNGELGFAAL